MRFIRFNIVGAAGMIVQLGGVAVLTRAGLDAVAATALGVELAILHNFVWHRCWTWRDRNSDPAMALARFHLGNGVVSLVGNTLLVAVLAGAGLDPFASNLIAIAACSIVNFTLADDFVFKAP